MIRSVLFAVVASLLLGACAALPQKPVEEVVKARVAAHQQARLENNFELAYSYTYGGLAGGKMGADTVMQREMNEKWIRADGEWWLLPTR